ncbi:methyl-accepting chemotaxis protein [Pararhodospirillum photometricum]|uniref:Methyl-accepting chemotaxis sensory transducer n=1 Tax=Pararhodospirillum photometricum DSM 122 TaxID=1150469 RepID=H6SMY4_PARPM|nr:methyl-accepting chemotaxis protein [Pararhodospirillum photometricum]CCG06860.1 Methyl-accepting chemotaxis sensory transducer [Pararhodospirillum photometricum DSM 122]
MPLRLQIIVSSVLVVLTGLSLLVFSSLAFQADFARSLALARLEQEALADTRLAGRTVNRAIAVVEVLAATMNHWIEDGSFERARMASVVREATSTDETFFGGSVVMAADGLADPDALHQGKDFSDATGRFVPYFYRSTSGEIVYEPVVVPTDGTADAWFALPQRERRLVVTAPFPYTLSSGQTILMATVAAPIKGKGGQPTGVTTIDLSLAGLQHELAAVRPYGVGWAGLVASDGAWVAHPEVSLLGTPVKDTDLQALIRQSADGHPQAWTGHDSTTNETVIRVAVPVKFSGAQESWTLVLSVPEAAVMAEARAMRTTLLLIGLGALILTVGTLAFVSNTVVRPLITITATLRRLADGDTSINIGAELRRTDEVGAMARAVATFREAVVARQDLEQQSQRDHEEAEKRRQRGILEIAGRFEKEIDSAVRTLRQSLSRIENVSENVRAGAQDSAERSDEARRTTETVATNVETVAAAMEQLAASVGEISVQMHRAQQAAQVGGEQAQGAVERVQGLVDAATQVGDVVTLITDIANSTNLLALNATIEAARAGDAGKGFAVVAHEVKSLATQTAQATDRIARQIALIQSSTARAAQDIEGVADHIRTLTDIATSVAGAVEEQNAATAEINRALADVSQGTGALAEMITSVSHGAQRDGEAIGTLTRDLKVIQDAAVDVEKTVEGFARSLRS